MRRGAVLSKHHSRGSATPTAILTRGPTEGPAADVRVIFKGPVSYTSAAWATMLLRFSNAPVKHSMMITAVTAVGRVQQDTKAEGPLNLYAVAQGLCATGPCRYESMLVDQAPCIFKQFLQCIPVAGMIMFECFHQPLHGLSFSCECPSNVPVSQLRMLSDEMSCVLLSLYQLTRAPADTSYSSSQFLWPQSLLCQAGQPFRGESMFQCSVS